MRRMILQFTFLLLGIFCGCNQISAQQEQSSQSTQLAVETKGVSAKILGESEIKEYLAEIDGRFKLRITSIDIEAGGYVGHHNHVGPGIRLMTIGRMEYVMPELTLIYGPGEHFFETGDVDHVAYNDSHQPNQHLLFEVLPASLAGASLIPSTSASRIQTDLSGLIKPES